MAERGAGRHECDESCSVTYSIVDPERFPRRLSPKAENGSSAFAGDLPAKKGQLEFHPQRRSRRWPAHGIETWFAGDFEPGTDPYAAACAAAAKPFAEQIRFLGYRSDLPELFRQASVVAVPSRHEGLMRGMIEAMTCGRPVVSFDVCSAREVLEAKSGGAGVVVPLGDHDGMADALIRFATDREAQAAAGRAGIAAARALFDVDQVVERTSASTASSGKTDGWRRARQA